MRKPRTTPDVIARSFYGPERGVRLVIILKMVYMISLGLKHTRINSYQPLVMAR